MWHFDSNIVIAYLNGQPASLRTRVEDHRGRLSVSTLVLAELLFGANKSARQAQNLGNLSDFLRGVTLVDFDRAAAEAYSRTRLALEQKGRPTGHMDLLIAAVAIAHNATLVTHNTKHFRDIDGLRLEDWLV